MVSLKRNTPSDLLPTDFTEADIQMVDKQPLYNGFFRLTRYRFRHRLFAGGMSGEVSREIFERGHAAALLAYDPKQDKIVLVEQLRIAALETSASPWLLELVAGIIEPGESPEQVVRREAQEEAGLTVQRCEPMLSYLASPAVAVSAYRCLSAKWSRPNPARCMGWLTSTKISKCTWLTAKQP